jgi:AhpD family alkylhydroperoxidase
VADLEPKARFPASPPFLGYLTISASQRDVPSMWGFDRENSHVLSQMDGLNRQNGCMNHDSTLVGRIDPWKAAPEVFKAALALETAVKSFGIDPKILELIKLRASQINGCAHCINLHFNDAVKAGESPQRLNLLPVWREAPHLYTNSERAVLRWTESLTKLPGNHVSDEDYVEISSHFNEAEVARITLAIATINAWNRFGTAFLPTVPATA